jgi:hypothetical protein
LVLPELTYEHVCSCGRRWIAQEGQFVELSSGACAAREDPTRITIKLGDSTWHDGPGWYYYDSEYPDEGSVGAFASCEAAMAHAKTGFGEDVKFEGSDMENAERASGEADR